MKNQVTKEIWAPARYIRPDGAVLDFTGLYEVSDLGRVRSLNYHRSGKTKVLGQGTTTCKDESVFQQVLLRKDNKSHTIKVHRLVLSSFKEHEYFLGALCDHIDARTSTSCDNRLCNLRWVTPSQNVSTEHFKTKSSKAHTNNNLTSKKTKVTDLNTNESMIFPSHAEAERFLMIGYGTISDCIKKRNGLYKGHLLFEHVY